MRGGKRIFSLFKPVGGQDRQCEPRGEPTSEAPATNSGLAEGVSVLPDRLLNVHEAAAFLGVTKHFVYQHSEIPRRKVCRKLRFSLKELDAWTKPAPTVQDVVRHHKAMYRGTL